MTAEPRTVVRTGGNRKIGPHTVSTARTRDTCPRDCDAWAECYGTNVTQTGGTLFDNVTRSPTDGPDLQHAIAAGRTRAVRFNVVGDFLRDGGTRVDTAYIDRVNAAADAAHARGLPAWSYTHAWPEHPDRENVTPDMFTFTVRASTTSVDGPTGARAAIAAGWPVAIIVDSPTDPLIGTKLDDGPRVVLCPAQVRADTTCETCRLCERPNVAVAFAAHGNASRKTRRPTLPVFTVKAD